MTDEAFCYFHENGLDFDGNEAWINEGERTHGENLGRKHGSSLCSQSEGHGHVAMSEAPAW